MSKRPWKPRKRSRKVALDDDGVRRISVHRLLQYGDAPDYIDYEIRRDPAAPSNLNNIKILVVRAKDGQEWWGHVVRAVQGFDNRKPQRPATQWLIYDLEHMERGGVRYLYVLPDGRIGTRHQLGNLRHLSHLNYSPERAQRLWKEALRAPDMVPSVEQLRKVRDWRPPKHKQKRLRWHNKPKWMRLPTWFRLVGKAEMATGGRGEKRLAQDELRQVFGNR
jgi:hypothetical protein